MQTRMKDYLREISGREDRFFSACMWSVLAYLHNTKEICWVTLCTVLQRAVHFLSREDGEEPRHL